ncbi:hypothetical protein BSL78_01631 [Apostichopus japonicus]|uniref:Hydroxylysine kinase n=1 Tax=Stichopus japonicus TaxID=307972 RepID=A0A2G8LMK6_STIJA|nr:hypothetical protein BSL78_01631 [Apostichopus japonicus]
MHPPSSPPNLPLSQAVCNVGQDVTGHDSQTAFLRHRLLFTGFIHGDYNDVNILVDQTVTDRGSEVHMSGFIDFDDAYYGCTVFDIGIAVMYALQSKTVSRDRAVASFLKGYGRVRRLNQLEKSCLYYCTAARFAQSLVFGLVNYASSKDEYVLGTQVRGWEALQEMWDRGQTVTYQKWEFL